MKIKKVIAWIVACAVLLTSCNKPYVQESNVVDVQPTNIPTYVEEDCNNNNKTDKEPENVINSNETGIDDERNNGEEIGDQEDFSNTIVFEDGINDPSLLPYIEDNLYASLEETFASDDYKVEGISAIYVSQEYIEELEYNSKQNVYFGYTIEEVEKQFGGQKYIFTLSENGETVVQPFEEYDDTFNRVVRNMAIGTGVILVCVVVSVATAGVGMSTVSAVFAASAKNGAIMAAQMGAMSGAMAGIATGFQTGSIEEALKAAALSGSQGFMMGAITGAVVGGVSEAITIKNAETGIVDGVKRTPRESEKIALEKYGGNDQVSYLSGEEVPWGTPGSTRPDIVIDTGSKVIDACEVKNYDLENNVNSLIRVLKQQVGERAVNLPAGSTQRIILDVGGRGYSESFVSDIVVKIQDSLNPVYPNIPIELMW